MAEFLEVKLGDPNFLWKIEGLRHFGVQRTRHAEHLPVDLDDRRLARMEEGDLAGGTPRDAPAVEPEAGEDVLTCALQVGEIDRRTLRFDAARRPDACEEDRDRA